MESRRFPFNPFVDEPYSPRTLLGDFDDGDSKSFQRTLDFRTYRYFVKGGRHAPRDYFDSMMQALHDNSITHSMRALLSSKERVIAIMGGHKMARNSAAYAAIVEIGRQLAREGVLVVSGGGPGAMEASHLGAYLATAADATVSDALTRLGSVAVIPAAAHVVDENGTVNEEIADALHAWYRPAFSILRDMACSRDSLGIPTWHYGHEPPTPFATHSSKYFQNSIREDGLLAIGKHGVVFAEGKAGTLQEIFQDAAQNYYKSFGWFSPMVLLGSKYWSESLPVVGTLKSLFGGPDFEKFVLVTDSVDAAVKFLLGFTPPKAF